MDDFQNSDNQLCTDKQQLRKKLDDPDVVFSAWDLQRIIDHEFFNDDEPMDADLIDAAARRLAALKGISAKEQYKETACAALKKLYRLK